MPGDDAALAAALQHRMHRDHPRVLQDAHLVGRGVHLHGAAARGVGHAVEIAVDRDHAVAGDAPLETQHRLERAGRQRLQMRAFLGKVFGDDAPWWWHARAALATSSSHCRNCALRSSRLRKLRPRKKSSRT